MITKTNSHGLLPHQPFKSNLVGGFNPSQKYDRQNGNLPQIGVKIKNVWNHRSCRTHRVGAVTPRQSNVWNHHLVICSGNPTPFPMPPRFQSRTIIESSIFSWTKKLYGQVLPGDTTTDAMKQFVPYHKTHRPHSKTHPTVSSAHAHRVGFSAKWFGSNPPTKPDINRLQPWTSSLWFFKKMLL